MLYPLKFKPIFKEKIWGGNKLQTVLGKKDAVSPKTGESWEISSVEGSVSTVSNGFLKGNSLTELLEVYMGDLVGEKNFEKYGTEFPLLIKFIDAADDLSVQVHPDDILAAERHGSFGKTEMWYVIQADNAAKLISGFQPEIDKEKYEKALIKKDFLPILQTENVKAGDVFFIPAGRVHAICKGILLAEIQQTSDITYRIFDMNRVDENGNERELHVKQAFAALDFDNKSPAKTSYSKSPGKTSKVISCPYFNTNIIEFENVFEKDYDLLDSFVIYICIEGEFTIKYPEGADTKIKAGEVVLLPAEMSDIQLFSKVKCTILEVYISDK